MSTTDTECDAIVYVDSAPTLGTLAAYGVPDWLRRFSHVHLRHPERCLKRDAGPMCDPVDRHCRACGAPTTADAPCPACGQEPS